MVMSPVYQVWPKPSCKAQRKGEEDKADRERGRKTEKEVGKQHQGMDWPGVHQVPEGSGEQGKMEKTGWLFSGCYDNVKGTQLRLLLTDKFFPLQNMYTKKTFIIGGKKQHRNTN